MSKVKGPGSFNTLVPGLAHGTDPSKGPNHPHGSLNNARTRHAVSYAPVLMENNNGRGQAMNGSPTGAVAASTATFNLENADIDCSTAVKAVLTIGEYQVSLFEIDELETAAATTPAPAVIDLTGTGAAAVLTAIAIGIDRLPGFSASAAGNTLSITGPAGPGGGRIPFKITHHGTTHFTSLTPSDGFMSVGGPTIGAPVSS
jgi:hypothetical protein